VQKGLRTTDLGLSLLSPKVARCAIKFHKFPQKLSCPCSLRKAEVSTFVATVQIYARLI